MTPAQLRSYVLTRAYLTALELSVDLQLAREDGATTEQRAGRLRISPATLLELERAWNRG